MPKSEFKIFDGYVQIADGELWVDTSPIEGLKRTYRRNKLLFTLFVIVWITIFFLIFFTDGVFGIEDKVGYVVANLLWLLAIISNKVSDLLGKKHTTHLSKNQ